MSDDDKSIERRRYDQRAIVLRSIDEGHGYGSGGAAAVGPELRHPYIRYEAAIARCVRPSDKVLEVGAGTGEFTVAALRAGAHVTATDISGQSLDVLSRRHFSFRESLSTRVADMELLPFEDGHFHCVTSAGALSYGDNEVVLREIHRVLRPGGAFICIDSLHHNLIFRANRWWHYLRGRRSRSTLVRMPTMSLIERYRQVFGETEVEFHGSLAWMMPVIVPCLGPGRAGELCGWFDRSVNVGRSAFKFVMVATKVP